MDNLLRHLAQRTQFGVQQNVGLFVKRFARGQQFANFFLRIRILQQGTMRLVLHALPDFFRRRPKADDERMSFKSGKIVRIGRQTAAGGNDRFGLCGKLFHNLFFQLPKTRLAVLLENLRYGFARGGLDQFVRVQIIKPQLLRHEPANGSFARAHKTDERNVDDAAVVVHALEVSNFARLDNL